MFIFNLGTFILSFAVIWYGAGLIISSLGNFWVTFAFIVIGLGMST